MYSDGRDKNGLKIHKKVTLEMWTAKIIEGLQESTTMV